MQRVHIESAPENLIYNKLTTIIDSQLAEQIKFKTIVLDLGEEKLTIYGRAAKTLRKQNLDQMVERVIKEQIAELTSVDCYFNYFAADLSFEDRLRNEWSDIVTTVKEEMSISKGWLSDSRWSLEESQSRLVIEVKNKLGVEKLQAKECDKLITQLIEKRFDQSVAVRFEVGDFSQEVEELTRQQEAENKEYIDSLMAEIDSQAQSGEQGGNSKQSTVIMGDKIKAEAIEIAELQGEEHSVTVEGKVINFEIRELKSGRNLVIFAITDTSDSITAKVFEKKDGPASNSIDEGDWLRIKGRAQIDKYTQELTVMPRDINRYQPQLKQDQAEDKRVELHLHTQMSAMDSVVDLEGVIKRAANWDHSALAITDHGVVQAFPEAYDLAQEYGVKLIYGLEAYLIDDGEPIVIKERDLKLAAGEYVVFDLETTGFNPYRNQIIEIGAVKVKDGEVVDTFGTLVNPDTNIPNQIVELTGINNRMVADAPKLEEVLPDFLEFIGDGVLVAHNLSFDRDFINTKLTEHGYSPLENSALDTLNLSRALLDLTSFKLNRLAKEFNLTLDNHHRAVDDAEVTAEILLELFKLLEEREIANLTEINSLSSEIDYKRLRPYHAVILVKNQQGLKNLYELVSKAHIETFHRVPRILKSDLLQKREGLIIGSACEAGQLYKAFVNGKDEATIREIAEFYDYLEIQPLGNTEFLVRDGQVDSREELKEINRQIYQLGEELDKPVVATGDVHFIDPQDKIFREILMTGQGFDDAEDQAPLYYRTTEEMLYEFDYFAEEVAKEVVVDNPKKIVEEIEEVQPVPEGLFTPEIEGAVEEVQQMTYNRARSIYGTELPEIVADRLEKELDAIIGNGFAVIYLISHKLVKKSLDDGYLVGSRGSVGSSLVATMCEITEVNPLPPHYVCPKCQYSKFFTDGSIGIGFDLDDDSCPECGADLMKKGSDIPFEVFMGFEGDKVPDIDLNFSGEYQPEVHSYTKELFGEDHVYRAGTISTIADRTAYGFVKGYMDDRDLTLRKAEVDRLVDGCTGSRRTTGQHPGGQMVVPQDKEIFDFSPIQRPANDQDSDVLTTHFDYHSISGRILKLDILGHDDPTTIRMLQDITGVDPKSIPLDDPDTMAIFSKVDPLGVTADDIGTTVGSLGIPEFGTSFVRQMLEDTRPTTFAELVRISGLSHGTDVWLNNAQDLIKKGTAELAEVISVRDDIMNYLLQKGVEPSEAFWIMEDVRHGEGLTTEQEQTMRDNDVPDWYIKSCKKIKYMFPKAHAVAYVMMAFRIAFFKVHYPQAFYNTYFTIKSDDFDSQIVLQGREFIEEKIAEIKSKGNDATQKDKNTLTVLEIVIEALERGIEFTTVDLYESKAEEFVITEDDYLRPPLITLQGLGKSAAESIVKARQDGEFTSIEELKNQTSISKTVIEVMKEHGCLEELPETNQLSFFN
ncbi:MAG: PolC-type DNA polymerase III [Bacillota bacterium]